MSKEAEILVGKKPPMNYVLACLTAFHEGAGEVVVKARGRSITKAVDVVEVIRRKFMPNAEIKWIDIGTDEIQLKEEQGIRRASSISIRLGKTKKSK
ncbi:MAG: DNA-binding protein Alba [Candidatus Methanomethylicaceae archaeon]